jgi:hypothetical protein
MFKLNSACFRGRMVYLPAMFINLFCTFVIVQKPHLKFARYGFRLRFILPFLRLSHFNMVAKNKPFTLGSLIFRTCSLSEIRRSFAT